MEGSLVLGYVFVLIPNRIKEEFEEVWKQIL
jgi:hypothetical protein